MIRSTDIIMFAGDWRRKDRKDSTVRRADQRKALASGYPYVHRRSGWGSGSLFANLRFEFGCSAQGSVIIFVTRLGAKNRKWLTGATNDKRQSTMSLSMTKAEYRGT